MNPAAPDGEIEIRAPSDDKTSEWITALAAAGFDYRLERDDAGWCICVPGASAAAARAELDAYEAVNQGWPPVPRPEPPAPPPSPASWSPLWVAGLLIAFYAWLGPYAGTDPILQAAAMDAEAVQAGQWWRVVTALMVHADVEHLLGNACGLLLLGHVACRLLGSGIAWSLILSAGVAGNALEAFWFPHDAVSIGASTASFGALGLLAAHRAVALARRWHFAAPAGRRMALPLGAGAALLALLGTGPRSDLTAHALGMLCGALAGAVLAAAGELRVPAWCHRMLELACITVLMLAWRGPLAE